MRPRLLIYVQQAAKRELYRWLGQPEDIGHMALYLASDESSFCNGAMYEVNGGMMCATPMVPVVRDQLR